ncbi:hypothetical protein [Streptomyces ficellus]|uniref:Uncharacterized protein n=1 Tax=Streptomyces ficellus TaxID=1977088 RepID=A0A6I6FBN6_9ACTN|nr:hypothetical protein [Streptomyces ficellus]QGV80454.1 hypothetical protein EIZ62_21110 [Streptomyces ficellus]
MRSFLRLTRVRLAAGAFAFVALFAVVAGPASDIGWPTPAPRPAAVLQAEGDIGWPVPPAGA